MRVSLPYRVRCMIDGCGGWEVIAAFNLQSAAVHYMNDCVAGKDKRFHYRVTKRAKVLRECSGIMPIWKEA